MADQCELDENEPNYPYDVQTFNFIGTLKDRILAYSRWHGVPPIAVAGSIADEYNILRGNVRRWNWLQDAVFKRTPSFFIELEHRLGLPWKLDAPRNDIGPGNLNMATARDIYKEYGLRYPDFVEMGPALDAWQRQHSGRPPSLLQKYGAFQVYRGGSPLPKELSDWADVVDFILSPQGTVVIATLVIRKGQQELAPWLGGRPPEIREALLVTYYKQGPSFVARYVARLAKDRNSVIVPGEGCRVYHQREAFKRALQLK